MNDEEILIHNSFLERFSTYQGFGVEIIYTNKSITLNYNEKSQKYIEALLDKFLKLNDMIIIFRCQGKNVSFTSKHMKYEELFDLVKQTMDSIKFNYGEESIIKDDSDIFSIINLFEKASLNKMDMTIGINRKDDDIYYKIVSKKYSIQEALKKEGITVREHIAFFRKSKVESVKNIFDSLKDNPLVLEYKIDNRSTGFISSLNVIFYIAVCFSSILIGIYLIINAS